MYRMYNYYTSKDLLHNIYYYYYHKYDPYIKYYYSTIMSTGLLESRRWPRPTSQNQY